MKCSVNDDVILSRPLEGPLSAYIAGFAKWARDVGYATYSRHRQVLLAACFSRWLGKQGIRVNSISSEHPALYLRSRTRKVRIHSGDAAVLSQFMDFLRLKGVIPTENRPQRELTPVDLAINAFEHYLRNERSLAEATVVNYVPFIHRFLIDIFSDRPVDLSSLNAGDIVRFVQRQTLHLHGKRAKLLTCALRSFLQYIRYRGDITLNLAAAVPTVASWSMTSIPRAIPSDAARQLLASIDRRTPMGRRDYAILLLLAKLGLRADEVVRLNLEDINWNVGCLSVQGKGSQRGDLPLPADVGAAIAEYLKSGRPRSSSRRVFLRTKAPIRGFLSSVAISSLVRHTIVRAGIKTPTKGAHQFRHALATEMLRHGASLTQIGEVLRHRSPETTMIYTKVDLDALRSLALSWPGGVR
jgi:integrase/recombinase XerD